jgi:hypothetical protein
VAPFRPRLRTLFPAALLLTTVCSPSVSVPVASTKPGHEEPGGGAGATGAPDGSVPDGSIPDGSTTPSAPDCYFCGGSSSLDAGCPINLTATQITTETAAVCVCEDQYGNTGCQFCSDANPLNGGCDAGSACTDICAPVGYFEICVTSGVTFPDQCYLTDGG